MDRRWAGRMGCSARKRCDEHGKRWAPGVSACINKPREDIQHSNGWAPGPQPHEWGKARQATHPMITTGRRS
eukprot:902410-Alexandrium_andersonii.AAC.1